MENKVNPKKKVLKVKKKVKKKNYKCKIVLTVVVLIFLVFFVIFTNSTIYCLISKRCIENFDFVSFNCEAPESIYIYFFKLKYIQIVNHLFVSFCL